MKNLKIMMEQTPDQIQLVQFMQGINEFSKKERYVKFLLPIVDYHILATIDNELIGWMALLKVNAATMLIFEWHPLVHQIPQQEEIKQKLLHEAFLLTRKLNIPNIRSFIDVNESNKNEFTLLENSYLTVGMDKTHIQDCMECQLSDQYRKDIKIPPDLSISSITTEKRENLQNTYEMVFKDSFDDFIHSLDDFELKEWDLFGESQMPDIAIILKKADRIIGFIGVRDEGDYIEFGPVGILTEFRGLKLGNFLINHTYNKLLELGKTDLYLEVGSRYRRRRACHQGLRIQSAASHHYQ